MQIKCPECQFAREVDETKIPARSQIATCPKCRTKFQFRDLPPEEQEPQLEIEPEQASAATESNAAKSGQPSQGTLPFDGVPKPPVETEQAEELSPSASEESVIAREEEPVFPHIPAPGEDKPQTQHPSGEIWDKLDSMRPPTHGEQEEHPAASRYDDVHYEEEPSNDPQEQPVPGWTGEFNEDFPDPMEEELKGSNTEEENSPLVPPPFEQLDRYGFFNGIFMTIKLVLTSPRLFFSVMPVGGGFSKPLTFTILVTMVQTFVQYFWSMVGLSSELGPDGGEQIAGAAGAIAPVFMLLLMPALVAATQFLMSAFYHFLLKIMRAGDQGFEGTFRALTYSNTPIILGLFPMPAMEIEIGWMFIVGAWGLFLTIVGLKHIHKTNYAKVIPVALIPLLLGMIAALAALQAGMSTI